MVYRNRRGKLFYLHVGRTKTGKERFSFSLKQSGTLAEAIPEGYEVYEDPNARVFLRKKLRSLVWKDEVEAVRNGIREHTSLRAHEYKIDLKKDSITVYLLDQDLEGLASLLLPFSMVKKANLVNMAEKYGAYTAMMRFCLRDEEKRVFEAERYCFLGRIEDWVPIGSPGKLERLVKRFAKHLGKESFYEIEPYGP